MRRGFGVSDRERAALDVFKRLRFLTREQLAYWMELEPVTAFRLIQKMDKNALVKTYNEQKPYVYRLSHSGAAIVGADWQQRWHSAPAIHQYLMRNEFEIFYRKHRSKDFKMIDRMRLKPFGLNCQIGEHPARLNSELVLVLIDDYLMRPSRALKVLDRIHETKNNEEYLARVKVTGKAELPTWRKAINNKKLLVVTTSEAQMPVYKRAYSRMDLGIDHSLFYLPPIWRVA